MNVHNKNLQTQIIEFVANHCGVESHRLTLETSINNDLGCDGDDAIELFESFGLLFSIDLNEIPFFDTYFIGEGAIFLDWITSLFKRNRKPDFTIKMLVDLKLKKTKINEGSDVGIKLIEYFSQYKENYPLDLDTKISEDLDIDGELAEWCLSDVFTRFNLSDESVKVFPFTKYFNTEGEIFDFWHPNKKPKKSLTIGELADFILTEVGK